MMKKLILIMCLSGLCRVGIAATPTPTPAPTITPVPSPTLTPAGESDSAGLYGKYQLGVAPSGQPIRFRANNDGAWLVSLDDAELNWITLTPRAAAPGSPTAGMIYYDSDVDKLYLYNGSAWVALN